MKSRNSILKISFCLCALLLFTSCNSTNNKASVTTSTVKEEIITTARDLSMPGIDLYQTTIDSLVAKDALNRAFDENTGYKDGKQVGMFYFTWIGQDKKLQTGIWDITKLLATNPKDLWNFDNGGPKNSPDIEFHFWGEPLYGYYNSQDPWVIRRHIELLTMSGIDYLVLDATNGLDYQPVWEQLFKILGEYSKKGWNVPKVVFYCNTDSKKTVERLYNNLYKPNYYSNIWYRQNGKPLIIAFNEGFYDYDGAKNLSEEIKSFFYFKEAQMPYFEKGENGFPWIDWKTPQEVYVDNVMNVSVAQHVNHPFSRSVLFKDSAFLYNSNFGRGYDVEKELNFPEKIDEGLNYENQWKTAIENPDVKNVFVTGFNEWIVQKLVEGGKAKFVDQMDKEFSRDTEMMKDGYNDNFFLQNIRNIRTFKGDREATINVSKMGTISMKFEDEQWKGKSRTYLDFTGDTIARDFYDAAWLYKYTDNSNRNDISKIKVTNDDKYMYMQIETEGKLIKDYSNDKWMNILIGVKDNQNNGWEGYNYILNRYPKDNGKTSIEKFKKGIFEFEEDKMEIDFITGENKLLVKIPLEYLNIKDANKFTFDFKVADNITNPDKIMNYYIYGDSAPIGRLNYRYNSGQ